MKNYTITVNGNVYDVTVEEKPAGFTPAQSASPVTGGSGSSFGHSVRRRKNCRQSRRRGKGL